MFSLGNAGVGLSGEKGQKGEPVNMNIVIKIDNSENLLRAHQLPIHNLLLRKYKVTTVMFRYQFLVHLVKRYIFCI